MWTFGFLVNKHTIYYFYLGVLVVLYFLAQMRRSTYHLSFLTSKWSVDRVIFTTITCHITCPKTCMYGLAPWIIKSYFFKELCDEIIVTICLGWYGISFPLGKVMLPSASPQATLPFLEEIIWHITLNKMW